jgi:hypothetical protein
MNLRKFSVVVLLGLASAVAAHAQFGVYGTYSATRLSGITCFDPQGQCSSTGGKVNPAGIAGGVYYDFKKVGPVLLGVDFRGGVAKSNKSATSSAGGENATESDTFLLGVRAVFHPKITWLKPYGQFSMGYARSNATEPFGAATVCSATNYTCPRVMDNFLQYEVFAGVDIHVLPIVDLRPVELGIGNMNRFGSGSGPGSVGVKSISAGFVFHLP